MTTIWCVCHRISVVWRILNKEIPQSDVCAIWLVLFEEFLLTKQAYDLTVDAELVPDVHHQRQIGVQAPVELMASAIWTCMYLIVCSIRFIPSTIVKATTLLHWDFFPTGHGFIISNNTVMLLIFTFSSKYICDFLYAVLLNCVC